MAQSTTAFGRLVVAEVNDLSSRGLDEAPHDVDGGVVAVKQGRCRDDTNGAGARREHDLFVLGHAPSSSLWFINSRVEVHPCRFMTDPLADLGLARRECPSRRLGVPQSGPVVDGLRRPLVDGSIRPIALRWIDPIDRCRRRA